MAPVRDRAWHPSPPRRLTHRRRQPAYPRPERSAPLHRRSDRPAQVWHVNGAACITGSACNAITEGSRRDSARCAGSARFVASDGFVAMREPQVRRIRAVRRCAVRVNVDRGAPRRRPDAQDLGSPRRSVSRSPVVAGGVALGVPVESGLDWTRAGARKCRPALRPLGESDFRSEPPQARASSTRPEGSTGRCSRLIGRCARLRQSDPDRDSVSMAIASDSSVSIRPLNASIAARPLPTTLMSLLSL